MEKITAVIQARTGSTRHPGKVLQSLEGLPMIEHIIKRIKKADVFGKIVLAIPDLPSEAPLEALAQKAGIDCVKGPEEDVLQRFILAGDFAGNEHIMRICGDNPLIDYNLLASLARHQMEHEPDLTIPSGNIPLGTGAEAVRLSVLKDIAGKTLESPYREHVTIYILNHEDQYQVSRIEPPNYLKNKDFRLTVDTPQDFQLIEAIYKTFLSPQQPVVDLEQVIPYLDSHPEITGINSGIRQKPWNSLNQKK